MKNRKKAAIIISWVLVAVCMGVIFFFSAQPGEESQIVSDDFKDFFNIEFGVRTVRKIAHFLEFAGLSFLVFTALFHTCGKHRPILSFLIGSAYAASDEIHQLFVEGRACMLFDFIVDSAGALCGALGSILLLMIINRNIGGKKHDGQC